MTATGLDDQSATSRHRVPGICNQIHENLVDLIRVCQHPAHLRAEPDKKTNVFSDQALEHALRFSYSAVQIQRLWLNNLLAA